MKHEKLDLYDGIVERIQKPRVIVFRVDDIPRLRRKWRPGTRFVIETYSRDMTQELDKKVPTSMIVEQTFKYFARCRRQSGAYESFSYVQLEKEARTLGGR